jgi:hypothetical protein
LSEGSTWHAQGVVVKAKTWKLAVAVLCAVQVLTAAVPGPVAPLDARLCMIDEDEDDDDDDMQGDTAGETKYRPPAGVEPFLAMYNVAIVRAWAFSCLLGLPLGFDAMVEGDRSMPGARAHCDILRNKDLTSCVREPHPQFAK